MFFPSELDLKRNNFYEFYYSDIKNLKKEIIIAINSNALNDSLKKLLKWGIIDEIFNVWKQLNKTSKYNSLKSKIDKTFDYFKIMIGNDELNIHEELKIDSVPIILDYNELFKNQVYRCVSYVSLAFNFIKKAKLKKSLYGLQSINIIPKSVMSTSSNMMNGVDLGTGANYNPANKEINVFHGRIQSKNGFIEGLTHEIGHHYFYHILDDVRKKQWIQFYDDLKSGELLIERRKLIEEMKKFHTFITDGRKDFEHNVQAIISNGGSRKDVENIKDYNKYKTFSMSLYEFPLLVEYVTTLDSNYGTMIIQQLNDYARIPRENEMYKNYGVYSDEDMQMTYNMFAQSVVTDIDILQTLAPSYYATKNYHELFAETFAAYCLRGTNIQYNLKLDDIVFRTFIDITNVRSATHEKVMHESTVTLKTLPKYQFLGIEEGEHVCEFCNRKHILYMYVVRDLDTGDIFRFGSTCIKKALGISSEDLKKVNKEFMKEYIEKFNQVTIPEYNKRRNSALNDFINDGKGDKYDWQLTKEYKDFEKEYNDIYQKYYDTMKIYK
jgi:hypothetical protein